MCDHLMDRKKISGFVPPIRVQRIWYMFKRQHKLQTKHSRMILDLHCRNFACRAVAIDRCRRKLVKAILDESQNHRQWIEDRLESSFIEPKRIIGV